MSEVTMKKKFLLALLLAATIGLSAASFVTKVFKFVNQNSMQTSLRVGAATLENTRGKSYNPLYPTQDRGVIAQLKDRVLLGVFDGHGKDGDVIAQDVRDSYCSFFIQKPQLTVQKIIDFNHSLQKDLTQRVDAQQSGTTAIFGVLNKQNYQFTAVNTGDSRLLVRRADQVVFVTKDHKPNDPEEKARILANGGRVSGGYAVNKQGGGLALSRSLGDCVSHDNDIITATPTVTQLFVQAQDCIILASDGLWDVMTNQDVIHFVDQRLKEGHTTQEVAQELVQEARHQLKSRDDITVVVIQV